MRALLVIGIACTLLAGCADSTTEPGSGAGSQVVELKAAGRSSCALVTGGTLTCWGEPAFPDLDPTGGLTPESLARLVVTDFDVTGEFGLTVCAATAGGGTSCWGGVSDLMEHYLPYPGLIQDTLPLTGLVTGQGHACGLGPSGAAYCWGSSLAGKRGEGASSLQAPLLTVNRVAGGLRFTALAADQYHTCGITDARTVYCWGVGDRLGDTLGVFTTEDCFIFPSCAWAPIPVRSLGAVTALSVGQFQSCALLENGKAWCWQPVAAGPGESGTGFPELVALPEPATQLSVGTLGTCALGSSGKVYCWGAPGPWRGTDDLATITEVATSLRFRSISTGEGHTCGVDLDGVPYCWGSNEQGQLGDGSTTDSDHPVRVHLPAACRREVLGGC